MWPTIRLTLTLIQKVHASVKKHKVLIFVQCYRVLVSLLGNIILYNEVTTELIKFIYKWIIATNPFVILTTLRKWIYRDKRIKPKANGEVMMFIFSEATMLFDFQFYALQLDKYGPLHIIHYYATVNILILSPGSTNRNLRHFSLSS